MSLQFPNKLPQPPLVLNISFILLPEWQITKLIYLKDIVLHLIWLALFGSCYDQNTCHGFPHEKWHLSVYTI